MPQPVPYCISYEFYIARIWTLVCRLSIFLVIFSESPSWLGSLFNPANITQISNMPFLLGLYNWQIILWSSHDTVELKYVVWGKNISTYIHIHISCIYILHSFRISKFFSLFKVEYIVLLSQLLSYRITRHRICSNE